MVEFAKRLISPESDYSPVGPKNVILSLKAPAHIPTLILDYIKKGDSIEFAEMQMMLDSLTHDIVKISKGKLESLL
jgi:hypothetical protein